MYVSLSKKKKKNKKKNCTIAEIVKIISVIFYEYKLTLAITFVSLTHFF